MFRQSSEDEYESGSEGGRRFLFGLDHFEFHDTLDAAGVMHHFVVEAGEGEEGPAVYEADQPTMYEFMARYLAGEYEKEEYEMERSPAHEALLDLLELATAQARNGETGFSFEELEEAGYEDEEYEYEEGTEGEEDGERL